MKRLILFFLLASFVLNLSACTFPEYEEKKPELSIQFTDPTEVPTIPETETETATTEPATEPTELPEETYPPREPDDEDFVRIIDYIPTARVELAYATVNNFTGYRIYDFTDSYLRYGSIKKLVMVSEELAEQGIGLIIWDGFRPAAAQAKLWEICPDPTFVSHPVTGKRTHCRGNTVDISLYDLETGEDLPVPTGYDNFTAYADRDYSDCSKDAATNARLLEQTMEKYGFTPYFAEWWHFADTKDYPIDEFFNPAIPTTWSANCNEYISLRSDPGGEVIAKIPKGATMELHSWDGKYAKVSYKGREGYVLTNYIMPEDDSYFTECLDTVAPTNVYSYEQMIADMETLKQQYPDVVSVASIGTTELGRDIPVIRIGDLNGRYHVLLQGAIHGREHLTAWLQMATADYWLDHGILGYGDVCYHIIPMTNPDGVIISQTGTLSDAQHDIYLSDKQNGYTTRSESSYATLWKANGEGIDATGSLIYYSYGDKETVNTQSKSLARAVKEISGYDLASSNGIDGAGYKDWVIDELEIPSLTIEIGCEEAALAEREIYSIFVRNYRVLPAIARWLQMQE